MTSSVYKACKILTTHIKKVIEMAHDIPVRFINDTGKADFEVVVFTKNFSYNTPRTYYVAWQVLRTMASVDFFYPASVSVGATYNSQGQMSIAGPFLAELGTTWEITQETSSSMAELKQSKL